MFQEEKFDGECKAMKDYHKPLRRMNSTDEMAVSMNFSGTMLIGLAWH